MRFKEGLCTCDRFANQLKPETPKSPTPWNECEEHGLASPLACLWHSVVFKFMGEAWAVQLQIRYVMQIHLRVLTAKAP